jgi:NAD(P)-dependent dehydrogenase (short-subunit alcohol dehydrogenase family)
VGWTVVLTGRQAERVDQVCREVADQAGPGRVEGRTLDLARLDDVARFAEEVEADHPELDVLVHNAGALVHQGQVTDDGLELTAQVHVVAPLALTLGLLGPLGAGSGGRVLTVSSGGMYAHALGSVDDLDPPGDGYEAHDGFDGVEAYARAKRAQVVLTQELARRTAGSGVAFHALHPGWVDTPGLAEALPGFHRRTGRWLRSPDQGVDTLVWLATDPAAGRPDPGGPVWFDRRRRWVDKVPWTATSSEQADELWTWASSRAGPIGRDSDLGRPRHPVGHQVPY